MPVQRVMACTRPDFDTATLYASYWAGVTLRTLEELGLIITDLLGDLANKDKLVQALDSYDPMSFWGVGHGNETQFAGQYAVIMLEKGVDELLFIGRIVHLTSCLTGVQNGLLEAIQMAGAIACMGYSVEVIVGLATPNIPDDPKSDVTKSLLAPDVIIEVSLAQGKAVTDAIIDSDNKSESEIEYWRSSGHPDADLIIFSLISNRDGKAIYGIPQAEQRVLAAPLSPLAVLGSIASIASVGLVMVKWH